MKVSNKKVSYKNLANLLQKSRRRELPPSVVRASLSETDGQKVVTIDGKNLAIDRNFSPVAVWNGQLADFISTSQSRLEVKIDDKVLNSGENELVMLPKTRMLKSMVTPPTSMIHGTPAATPTVSA